MPTSSDPVADEPALLRLEGPIATITLNRPAAFNSIDLAIARKLEQLGAAVEASDEIRVLVIEGEGRAFCGGGICRPSAPRRRRYHRARGRRTAAPLPAFITTLRRMPKIVLASVHGSAAGAGMSLAFVADLCIAANEARFTPAYAKLVLPMSTAPPVTLLPRHPAPLEIDPAAGRLFGAQAYDWAGVAKAVAAVELKAATRERRNAWRRMQPPPWRPPGADHRAPTSRSKPSSMPSATPSSTACIPTNSALP